MGETVTEQIAVEAKDASKTFGPATNQVRALDKVSISIKAGEFFTLLGPSGCGKTTLLRLIAGFETPTSGSIWLEGVDITALPPNKRAINTVFQNYALFPHLTVAENVGFGLKMQGKPVAEVRSTVEEMLGLVKLQAYANRKTAHLSGGQQQRVALARALAPRPKVLLLDEPLSALDLKLRKEMQIELKSLQLETGITFIFVTHDQEEALTMSDRIGVMKDGHVLQIGTPRQIYNAPANRFVASFIGETNFLDGEVTSSGVAVAKGVIPLNALAGKAQGNVSLAVRPEQVRIGADGLPAEITNIVYFGTDTHCHVVLEDGVAVVARLQSPPDGDVGLSIGSRVKVSFAPSSLQILGE
jgi:spermidine/putrescine transport system ATP-binding protein